LQGRAQVLGHRARVDDLAAAKDLAVDPAQGLQAVAGGVGRGSSSSPRANARIV
jgi:hypothetical protein